MFLLDTNVLSELIKPTPSPNVVAWVELQLVSELYISSITVAEMLRGVEALPSGKRKLALERAVTGMINEDFYQRVLSFDQHAAEHYAWWVQQRQNAGRPVSQSDAQIAGIALATNATLVTRNTKDFDGLKVGVINPWGAPH